MFHFQNPTYEYVSQDKILYYHLKSLLQNQIQVNFHIVLDYYLRQIFESEQSPYHPYFPIDHLHRVYYPQLENC